MENRRTLTVEWGRVHTASVANVHVHVLPGSETKRRLARHLFKSPFIETGNRYVGRYKTKIET
jgi:hypothetical protein